MYSKAIEKMHGKRTFLFAIALCGAALNAVTACSTPSAPDTSAPTTINSPSIARPIDIRAQRGELCATVRQAIAAKLHLTETTARENQPTYVEDGEQVVCGLTPSKTADYPNVAVRFYLTKSPITPWRQRFGALDPATVPGYPAGSKKITRADNAGGLNMCVTFVDLAPDQGFSSTYSVLNDPAADSCAVATDTARSLVDSLAR